MIEPIEFTVVSNDWVWTTQSGHFLSMQSLKDRQIKYYINKKTFTVERYSTGLKETISEDCKDLETAKCVAVNHFQYLINRMEIFQKYKSLTDLELKNIQNKYNDSISKIVLGD